MPSILEKARIFAIEKHSEQQQMYGVFPYAKHLRDVDNVLVRFGLVHELELRAAAWLHDVLEDIQPAIPYALIADMFGTEVFNLVYAVSDDAAGKNRKERKALTFKKLKLYQSAIPLKLADRIANIEWSLLTNIGLLRMYLKEHNEFEENLRDDATNLLMWKHLDYLVDLGKFAIQRVDTQLRSMK